MYHDEQKLVIEELKTTQKDLVRFIEENIKQHRLQAFLYALMFLENFSEKVKVVTIKVVYFQQDTKKELIKEEDYFLDDVIAEATKALSNYESYIKQYLHHLTLRNIYLDKLEFPFNFRKDQHRFAGLVYRNLMKNKTAGFQAPTGCGKSISTLFPALKTMKNKGLGKIFYLSGKNSGKTSAFEAIEQLSGGKSNPLRAIILGSKEIFCLNQTASCIPLECVYASNYYAKRKKVFEDVLLSESLYNQKKITSLGKKYEICPFELSLDLSLLCDVIICDYNHVFHPRAMLKRYFGNIRIKPLEKNLTKNKNFDNEEIVPDDDFAAEEDFSPLLISQEITHKYVFLIDEAHNLIERSQNIYSSELLFSQIDNALIKLGKKNAGKLRSSFEDLKDYFTAFKIKYLHQDLREDLKETLFEFSTFEADEGFSEKQQGNKEWQVFTAKRKPYNLLQRIFYFNDYLEKYLVKKYKNGTLDLEKDSYILDLYFNLLEFERISQLFGDNYLALVSFQKKNKTQCDLKLNLLCLDASYFLKKFYQSAQGVVLFSATMLPEDFIYRFLALPAENPLYYIKSPFDYNNCEFKINSSYDLRYKERDKNCKALAQFLHEYFSDSEAKFKEGTILIFFNSYTFMSKVLAEYDFDKTSEVKKELIVQQRDFNKNDKDQFLKNIGQLSGKIKVVFAVLGSIFSEGIDIKGNVVKSVIIIGTGLPGLSIERNLQLEYFNDELKSRFKAFDYCYTYPGIVKVLQAAGRLIRSENDRGEVVLIDKRYSSWKYFRILEKYIPFKVSINS